MVSDQLQAGTSACDWSAKTKRLPTWGGHCLVTAVTQLKGRHSAGSISLTATQSLLKSTLRAATEKESVRNRWRRNETQCHQTGQYNTVPLINLCPEVVTERFETQVVDFIKYFFFYYWKVTLPQIYTTWFSFIRFTPRKSQYSLTSCILYIQTIYNALD